MQPEPAYSYDEPGPDEPTAQDLEFLQTISREPEPPLDNDDDDDEPYRICVYSAAALAALELPQPATPVVGPWVRKAMITLLAGMTGHGKTTLIAQLVKVAADGGEFLGETVAGGNQVLVLDLEQHLASIQRVIEEAGLTESTLVDYAPVPEGLAIDRRTEQYAAVEQLFASKPYDVVVIDPFYKLHMADSNDEAEARVLVAHLRRWISTYGFAMVTATHCRKLAAGRNAIGLDDLYGSSLFTRDPEIILGLQRHGDLSKLHVFKSREPGLTAGQTVELLFSRSRGYWLKPTVDPEERAARLREIAAFAVAWIEASPGQSTNKVTDAVKTIAKCGTDLVEEALELAGKSGLLPEPLRGSRRSKLWYPHNHAALTSPQTLLGEVTGSAQNGQSETTSPDLTDLYVVEGEAAGEVVEARW